MDKLPGALLRFRIMAWIAGLFLIFMAGWWVLGYGFWGYSDDAVKPEIFEFLWSVHGFLYFVYLVVGIDLCFRIKLSVVKTLAVLLAGTVPFMSFVADYQLHKYVRTHHLESKAPVA